MAPEEAVTLPPDPVAVMLYVTEPVVDVGVSVTVPLRVTAPLQLPSVEDAVTLVTFVVAIVHTVLLPSGMLVGVQVSVAVGACALTVTVALALALPAAFVAVMVYVERPIAVGVTVAFPVRLVLVVKPGPETDALVALLPAFHVITVVCPSVMMPGFEAIVGAGSVGAPTVIVTEAASLVPPSPAQVMLYVAVAVGDTDLVPLMANVPDQAPPAVHEVAEVLLHVRVEDWPEVMVNGLPLSVAVGLEGGGVVTVLLVFPPQAVIRTATAESRTCAKTVFFI